MYKPLSSDPKCSFSVSLPVSLRKIIDSKLNGKSRSEFIKEAVIFWLKKTVQS
ncbi:CopG family transcriptional regulator [bacterium]|nr:CopG family transcriptional regulator [bacterium]